jgi:hypothetical protein
MEWIGYILLVVAIFEFCFGLFDSFTSEAGAIGQVPVLMHALAFPLFLSISVAYLRPSSSVIPTWSILIGFLILVFLDGFLIQKIGALGKAFHERQKNKNSEQDAATNRRNVSHSSDC